jgi:hypothetical protein
MKDYKTPVSRLARIFKKSLEKWKARSLEKQKKLRTLEVKVRDIQNSRARWKERAIKAEKENVRLKKELEKEESDLSNEIREISKLVPSDSLLRIHTQPPSLHMYPVFLIYLSIRQVCYGLTGFRGAQRCVEVVNELFPVQVPSYSTIRLWSYRLGLYLLQRPVEYERDRIFILDMTIELGSAKCLLILGTRQIHLEQSGFCLSHKDVEVLGLEVFFSSSGEKIAQCLEQVSARAGKPVQIIADQGSDIKKGIGIYQSKHPDVDYIPDLSHKIAIFVKELLHRDTDYKDFNAYCGKTQQALNQTPLNFLKPPSQRSQARYHHIAPRIEWAEDILNYYERGDFSLINTGYRLSMDTLLKEVRCPEWEELIPLTDKVFPDVQTFDNAFREVLLEKSFEEYRDDLHKVSSLGRQKFEEKFDWLPGYQTDIDEYKEMVEVIEKTETQLKHEGLHLQSVEELEKEFDNRELSSKAARLKEQIVDYMEEHSQDLPEKQCRLVSSDIIESIFGQYKHVRQGSPLKEIGKMILMIPLFVTNFSVELIKEAMETVKTVDVEKWAEKTFGPSSLARRMEALTPT